VDPATEKYQIGPFLIQIEWDMENTHSAAPKNTNPAASNNILPPLDNTKGQYKEAIKEMWNQFPLRRGVGFKEVGDRHGVTHIAKVKSPLNEEEVVAIFEIALDYAHDGEHPSHHIISLHFLTQSLSLFRRELLSD